MPKKETGVPNLDDMRITKQNLWRIRKVNLV